MMRLRSRLGAVHTDHHRIARGAARVAFFLLLGKFAGAAKEMAVAYRYGISSAVDAYQFTLTLAGWLPTMLVGVLSVVLIPTLVRLRDEPQADQARFMGQLQGAVLALGVGLAGVSWLAWPQVLGWAGKGLSPQAQAMSQSLILAFAPAVLLILLTGLSAARLRARERHINTLLDGVPAVAILIAILLSAGADNIAPLLWGTLVGYVIQCVWLACLARRADGFWGRPQLAFSAAPWQGLLAAAGVMVIGQIAMSFVGPIDQYTAANLGDHANATLGYATRLLSLVLGLGAASVGRAALPVLADVQRAGDATRARALALKWSAAMWAAGVLVAGLGMVLAPWGVSVLFERGAFTAQDTVDVAQVLRWGMLQLPFYFGVLVLVQLLASQSRYRIMAAIAVANFGVKVLLNGWLAPRMGVAGIMLATSGMYALSFMCYAYVAWRQPGGVRDGG